MTAVECGALDGLEAVLADYRRDRERRNIAAGTIYRQARTLRSLARWCADHDLELMSLTRDDIELWFDSLSLAAGSTYVYQSALSSFFKWATSKGLAADNPLANMPRPLLPSRMPRPMATGDFAHAFAHADDRMRAWLALGAYQGLRCHEIAGVRAEDLLLDRDPPLLLVAQPKGRRQRLLPLNPTTEAALRVHGIPQRGHLFTANGRPIRPGTVSTYVNRYLRYMGLRSTAHQLRHLFGTEVYRVSRDIRITQAMLGHADPKTTSIYVAFSPGDAADTVRGLSYVVDHG